MKFSEITASASFVILWAMATSPSTRRDLKSLHRLISEADLILETISNPHPSLAASRENLKTALALSADLAKRQPNAVALGAKGGKKTAERGPEYFSKIAAMRKTKAGGRPRKADDAMLRHFDSVLLRRGGRVGRTALSKKELQRGG